MKKLSIVLVLLLVLGGGTCFALDFSYGGNLGYFFEADQNEDDSSSNIGKFRLNFTATGEYNTAVVQLKNDTLGSSDVTDLINYAYLKTDISGFLGLDVVGITTRFGKFEEYASYYTSPTSANRARKVETNSWVSGSVSNSGQAAINLDVGPVGILGFARMGDSSSSSLVKYYKVGLYSPTSALVEGLKFFTSFNGSPDDDDYLKGELGYTFSAGDIGVYFPASALYNITDEKFDWGTGVKLSNLSIVDFNLGVAGAFGTGAEDDDFVNVLDAEVYLNVIENGAMYAKVYTQPTETDIFGSADIGAKYKFNVMTFYIGYVAASSDTTTTLLCEDSSSARYSTTGSGLYLAAKMDF